MLEGVPGNSQLYVRIVLFKINWRLVLLENPGIHSGTSLAPWRNDVLPPASVRLILYSHIHPDSRGSQYDSSALCVHRLNCCILSCSAQEKRVQRTRKEENCERRPHSGNIALLVSPFAVYILYCPVIRPFRSSPSQPSQSVRATQKALSHLHALEVIPIYGAYLSASFVSSVPRSESTNDDGW